ncbi:leucine-rich repeat domain-containing protein [Enterococcus innesii]|uniref:leucine-rich repeat domain-containing protein n=1 Tax=Enterococcus TaxID=1350 RepID=UPI003D0B0AF3
MTNGTSQGLFIVVAIIIFGIFTLTSYVLFKDNLKPTLANIFTNGFNQANTALNKGSILENNINTDESNSTIYNNQLYVKIREKNEAKNETEVWVLLEELKDGTYAIKASGIDNTSPNYDIQGYSTGLSGSSSMTGDLILPDTINGKKITLIKESAFYFSKFNGQLTLPKYLQSIEACAFGYSNFRGSLTLPDSLQSIGNNAFECSEFTGSLTLPDSLQSIGSGAFYCSKFTGSLTLPNSLQSIGSSAFIYSNFSGSLTLPDSLQSIGQYAFNFSYFSGTLDISNVTNIEYYAFGNSEISTVKNDSLNNNNKTIDRNAIRMDDGSYYRIN